MSKTPQPNRLSLISKLAVLVVTQGGIAGCQISPEKPQPPRVSELNIKSDNLISLSEARFFPSYEEQYERDNRMVEEHTKLANAMEKANKDFFGPSKNPPSLKQLER
jgi:hypothetical protein